MIWRGSFSIISGEEALILALNWFMSFLLYVSIAWFFLFIFRIVFVAPFQLSKEQRSEIEKLKEAVKSHLTAIQDDLIRLNMLNVLFDINGPTEFYIDFRIENPSRPTILRNWRLMIDTPKLNKPILVTPRLVSTKVIFGARDVAPIIEALTKEPLEEGGFREEGYTFSFSVSAKDEIGERDATFGLSVDDVKNRTITAQYSCAIIPTV